MTAIAKRFIYATLYLFLYYTALQLKGLCGFAWVFCGLPTLDVSSSLHLAIFTVFFSVVQRTLCLSLHLWWLQS